MVEPNQKGIAKLPLGDQHALAHPSRHSAPRHAEHGHPPHRPRTDRLRTNLFMRCGSVCPAKSASNYTATSLANAPSLDKIFDPSQGLAIFFHGALFRLDQMIRGERIGGG
jgi:hypothetical protein